MTFSGGGEFVVVASWPDTKQYVAQAFHTTTLFNSFNSFTPKDGLNTIIMIIVIIKLLRTACTSNLSF